MTEECGPHRDVELARELVVELLRTGLALANAMASLLDDLPADAFPGEDHAEVLLEMVAGSCAPVVQAAGDALCRDALGLIGAVHEKFLIDLRAAADLASQRQK